MPGKRGHGDGGIDQLGPDRWRIRWRLDGRRYTRVVHGSKQAAQRELRRVVHEKEAVDRGLTIAGYIRSWLDGDHDLQPKTRERYRQLLEHQIAPHLGDTPLQELRPVHVKTWLDGLVTSGSIKGGDLSTTTVGHARRLLHTAFEKAVGLEIVSRNPVHPVRAPKADTGEIEILTADQVADMLAKLAGHELEPIALTALGTGMRRGELCALQWGDVDLDAAKITVCRAMTQTSDGIAFKDPKSRNSRRTIPLAPHTVAVLRGQRRRQSELWLALGLGRLSDDDLVFARGDGMPHKPNRLSWDWTRAVRALGLPAVSFHALRHTFASAALAAGVNVVTVSRHLGHGNPSVTLRVYSHMFKQDDRAAADAIERVLNGRGA